MIVFLVSVLVVSLCGVIALQAWVHVSQSRDWREERAVLLQATMSRSLPEFSGAIHLETPRQPIIREYADEDFPVGI